MSDPVLALMEGVVAAATSIPKLTSGNQRIASGQQVLIQMDRKLHATDDGQVTVYGANLPPVWDDTLRCEQVGTGAATVFDTNITYAAFSNYNFVALVAGVVLEQGAGAAQYQVSDNAGKARITFGTAPAAGAKVVIAKVTPVALVAQTTAAQQFATKLVTSKDLVWAALAGATVGATNVHLHPLK